MLSTSERARSRTELVEKSVTQLFPSTLGQLYKSKVEILVFFGGEAFEEGVFVFFCFFGKVVELVELMDNVLI